MHVQELMVQHPFGPDGVFGRLSGDASGELPRADHVIEQRILHGVLRPVERLLGERRTGGKEYKRGCQEVSSDRGRQHPAIIISLIDQPAKTANREERSDSLSEPLGSRKGAGPKARSTLADYLQCSLLTTTSIASR